MVPTWWPGTPNGRRSAKGLNDYPGVSTDPESNHLNCIHI